MPPLTFVDVADVAVLDQAWQSRRTGSARCSSDGAPIAVSVPTIEGIYRLTCPQCMRTSRWFEVVSGGMAIPRSPETLPAPGDFD